MNDQNHVDALEVGCGLPGCARPPGEPCVNSLNGQTRGEPHWNRVARARRLGDVLDDDRCPRCGDRLYSPAETEQHNRAVHNFGPVETTSWGAEP